MSSQSISHSIYLSASPFQGNTPKRVEVRVASEAEGTESWVRFPEVLSGSEKLWTSFVHVVSFWCAQEIGEVLLKVSERFLHKRFISTVPWNAFRKIWPRRKPSPASILPGPCSDSVCPNEHLYTPPVRFKKKKKVIYTALLWSEWGVQSVPTSCFFSDTSRAATGGKKIHW